MAAILIPVQDFQTGHFAVDQIKVIESAEARLARVAEEDADVLREAIDHGEVELAIEVEIASGYFFGPKASVGVEVEGNLTFGPAGRVVQFMGSFVMQTGARTSKFVPYIAVGGGILRASTGFPQATADALAELGIIPEPTTETAPFIHFGGGLRFYVRPKMAFRIDARMAQVALDLDGVGFSDSLFPMRRVAGMISWDF